MSNQTFWLCVLRYVKCRTCADCCVLCLRRAAGQLHVHTRREWHAWRKWVTRNPSLWRRNLFFGKNSGLASCHSPKNTDSPASLCSCFWSRLQADKSLGLKNSCHMNPLLLFATVDPVEVFTQAWGEDPNKREAGVNWGRGLNNRGWDYILFVCRVAKNPQMRGQKLDKHLGTPAESVCCSLFPSRPEKAD